MKRVLVTGGAGFIGSHLCQSLLEDGSEVFCLDSLQTGSRENVAVLASNSGFHFIKHDVIDPLYIDVDDIYHLACPASPVHYQADPIRTLKTNVIGTLNILALAKRVGARVLITSTSEIYGDPMEHPQNENYWGNVNPFGPRACYDEGKRCAETLAYDYHHEYGVAIKVARIFNTYGPRMDPEDGRVVSNFIVQALLGKPLTIYGSGAQTRSFCFVDDTVDALVLLMGTPEEVTGPINIGNPAEYRIDELANMIQRLTGSTADIHSLPLPQDDPRKRRPDITLAGINLGWYPVMDLEAGLLATIEYFRCLLNDSKAQQAISLFGG